MPLALAVPLLPASIVAQTLVELVAELSPRWAANCPRLRSRNSITRRHLAMVACQLNHPLAVRALRAGERQVLERSVVPLRYQKRQQCHTSRPGCDYASPRPHGPSFAEQLQAAAPQARVVKAFNTIVMRLLRENPARLTASGTQVFLAGDDAEAKAVAAALAADAGLGVVDLGRLDAAWLAESMADAFRQAALGGGRADAAAPHA